MNTELIMLAVWSAVVLQSGVLPTSYLTNMQNKEMQKYLTQQKVQDVFLPFFSDENMEENQTSLLTSMHKSEIEKVKQESEKQTSADVLLPEQEKEETISSKDQENEKEETKTVTEIEKQIGKGEVPTTSEEPEEDAKTKDSGETEEEKTDTDAKKDKEKTEDSEDSEVTGKEESDSSKEESEKNDEDAEKKEQSESEETAGEEVTKEEPDSSKEESEKTDEDTEKSEQSESEETAGEEVTEEGESDSSKEESEKTDEDTEKSEQSESEETAEEEVTKEEDAGNSEEDSEKADENKEKKEQSESEETAEEEEVTEKEEPIILNTDPNTFTFLVNKEYVLPADYVPKLVEPQVNHCQPEGSHKRYMRAEAASALEEMFAAAKKKGYDLFVKTAYRSYKNQYETYTWMLEFRGVQEAVYYHAVPGTSEHQTGLAVDIVCEASGYENDLSFEKTKEYKWLKENCHKYGFTLRYLKGMEHITGYNYEPWHYRYVGIELATYLMENNLTLEEYYGALPTTDLFQVPEEYRHLIKKKTESK